MGKKRRYRKYAHKFGRKYASKYGLNSDIEEGAQESALVIIAASEPAACSGAAGTNAEIPGTDMEQTWWPLEESIEAIAPPKKKRAPRKKAVSRRKTTRKKTTVAKTAS